MEKKEIIAESTYKRVDAFLAETLSESRSYFATLIQDGHIMQNGKIPKKSDSVKVGDKFSIVFPKEAVPDITPKEIPFTIIYDTPRYSVIDKPAGITVHPAPGHYDDSLVNGLLHAFNIQDDMSAFRPGIVHRLDKDTSGLLLVAKDRQAREKLSKLFADRQIRKFYTAIASGKPRFKEIMVDQPIGRDKFNRQRMAVTPDGRSAQTKVIVETVLNKGFIANIELFTGRTHQIRVHMKYLGFPLIGDTLYGGVKGTFERQALHARQLIFQDPFTDENIDVSANLPEDMQELIKKL